MGTNGAEEGAMNGWLRYALKFNFPLKFRRITRDIQRAAL